MDLVPKDSGEAAHEANAGALTITTTCVKSRNAIAARCCALERAALLLCCAGGRGAEGDLHEKTRRTVLEREDLG